MSIKDVVLSAKDLPYHPAASFSALVREENEWLEKQNRFDLSWFRITATSGDGKIFTTHKIRLARFESQVLYDHSGDQYYRNEYHFEISDPAGYNVTRVGYSYGEGQFGVLGWQVCKHLSNVNTDVHHALIPIYEGSSLLFDVNDFIRILFRGYKREAFKVVEELVNIESVWDL